MRHELEEQNRGGPVQQFFNKPWVIVLLLLFCVGVIAWTFWPPGPEGLYRRAAALMASEDPDDWERARREYLEILQRKFPDHPHQEEVRRFQQQIDAYEVSREATRRSRHAGPMTEAQWFYQQGLRQRQEGDEPAARATWKRLIQAFADVPSEGPWVRLAEQRLNEGAEAKRDFKPIRQALQKAAELRKQGKMEEANAIVAALKELYRDDKQAQVIIGQE